MSERVANFLANGREYIETYGWWRNSMRGPNGNQACLVGGLLFGNEMGEQNMNSPIFIQALTRVASVIDLDGEPIPFPTRIDHVMSWNDCVSTDKQQVLDVLAKAEKIERAGFDPDA